MVVEEGVDSPRMVVGGNLLEVGVGNPEEDIVPEVVHRMELLEEDIVLGEDIRCDCMLVEVEEDIPADQEGIVVRKGVVHPEDRIPDNLEEEALRMVLVEVENILEANMTLRAQMLTKTNFENRLTLEGKEVGAGGL